MSLSQIIANAIREAGGDGLCNEGLDCGCGLTDLYPCGSPDPGEREIAVKHTSMLGDDWFFPIRKEDDE